MLDQPNQKRAAHLAVSREIDAMLDAAINRASERGDERQIDWLLRVGFDATVLVDVATTLGGAKPGPSANPGRWE